MFREFLSLGDDMIDEEKAIYTGTPLTKLPFLNRRYCKTCRQHSLEKRTAFMKMLEFYIGESFERQPALVGEAKENIFVVLQDAYKLIASEWMVVYECLNRDLQEAEHRHLQRQYTHKEYKRLLRRLFGWKTNVQLYCNLIKEAKDQCSEGRLKALSISNSASNTTKGIGKSLEADYNFVSDQFQSIITRFQEDIKLLADEIGINAAEKSSHLSQMVAIFASLSLCISFLGLQEPWGLGGDCLKNTTIPLLVTVTAVIGIFAFLGLRIYSACRKGFLGVLGPVKRLYWRQKFYHDCKAKDPKCLDGLYNT